MASKTKGLAIVINILSFPGRQRVGSEIDLTNMVHLFREIGYEVESHEDLTARVSVNIIHTVILYVKSNTDMFRIFHLEVQLSLPYICYVS